MRDPTESPAKPAEFFPYLEVPAEAVAMGERIIAAGGLDVGGIEYLESAHNHRIFYEVNANSNLRVPIGEAFGFNPFDRLVDYLTEQIARTAVSRTAAS